MVPTLKSSSSRGARAAADQVYEPGQKELTRPFNRPPAPAGGFSRDWCGPSGMCAARPTLLRLARPPSRGTMSRTRRGMLNHGRRFISME